MKSKSKLKEKVPSYHRQLVKEFKQLNKRLSKLEKILGKMTSKKRAKKRVATNSK